MPTSTNPDLDDFNTILRPHSTSCSVIGPSSSSHTIVPPDSDSVTGTDHIPDTTLSALPAITWQYFETKSAGSDAESHLSEEDNNVSLGITDLPSLAEGLSTSASPLTSASAGCTPLTPEVEGYASTRLHFELDKRKYVCEVTGCSKSFMSPKDLRRHRNSDAHAQTDTLSYQCRCGYSTRRKDHYRRHLRQNMGKKQCKSTQRYFYCICKHSAPETDLLQQLQHIDNCASGRGTSGRPRKA
ncbi:hypothetical protein CCUS01_08894 [Colletotrichum cuscutae]|uniref:C2H2-type domain-containing protein n=1 Tax=Colletotrichum cuscutae TaxID=1209917 RepID=A0AAI9UPQ3_9PEZI|nr:hypothetical protein CCUS01_08894 [Colletotrichum cuscutae]